MSSAMLPIVLGWNQAVLASVRVTALPCRRQCVHSTSLAIFPRSLWGFELGRVNLVPLHLPRVTSYHLGAIITA